MNNLCVLSETAVLGDATFKKVMENAIEASSSETSIIIGPRKRPRKPRRRVIKNDDALVMAQRNLIEQNVMILRQFHNYHGVLRTRMEDLEKNLRRLDVGKTWRNSKELNSILTELTTLQQDFNLQMSLMQSSKQLILNSILTCEKKTTSLETDYRNYTKLYNLLCGLFFELTGRIVSVYNSLELIFYKEA